MLDIFRQVNWIVFIPHGILLTLITLLLLSLGVKNDLALLVAAFIYMGLSMLLHAVIPTNHRLGITLLKQGNFEAAKKSFDKSYEVQAIHHGHARVLTSRNHRRARVPE